MKTKIISSVICVLIFLVNTISYPQDNKNEAIAGLKLIISTDKSTYLEGEVIWEEFQLIVDKSIKLDYKPYFIPNDEIIEKVVNSKDEEMPKMGPSITHIGRQTEYPDTINYFSSMNIGTFENLPNSAHPFRWAIYLPADEYEFSAYVIVSMNGEKYVVKSQPVKFTVLKPEGDEILARQAYLEILSLIRNSSFDLYTISVKVDNFRALYKNSIYLDQVLRFSDPPYFEYNKKTIDEVISITEEIIKIHPSFASNFERFKLLMSNYASKNDLYGFKKFIEELKSQNKNNSTLNKVLYHLDIK